MSSITLLNNQQIIPDLGIIDKTNKANNISSVVGNIVGSEKKNITKPTTISATSNITGNYSYPVFHIPTLDNIWSYKKAVSAIPDLNAAQESSLAYKFNVENCLKSAQQLIFSQLKTVVKVAQEFKNYGLNEADLIQEGNIGLMKAVKNYNPDKQVRLYTYSIIWIRAEIQNYILNNWKMVKLATTKTLKKLFFSYRSTYKQLIDAGVPKSEIPKQIVQILNVEKEDVQAAKEYFTSEDVSISEYDDSVDVNKSDSSHDMTSKKLTPMALIDYKTPQNNYEEFYEKDRLVSSVTKAMDSLSDKEKLIINSRYFQENKLTHKELATKLGISSERVRQIEQGAYSKIKKFINHSSNDGN